MNRLSTDSLSERVRALGALDGSAAPETTRARILRECSEFVTEALVVGSTLTRAVIVIGPDGSATFVASEPWTREHPLLQTYATEISLDRYSMASSTGTITESAVFHLVRPHVRLVALYHPEQFPLPRFPLGISDIAGAIRERYRGSVTLRDMQLGWTIETLVGEVGSDHPDILGISATFGQFDLLDHLLRALYDIPDYRPTVIIGGSLAALVAIPLLERYPELLVAVGGGEETMCAVVEAWHGLRPMESVPGIMYIDAVGMLRQTPHARSREVAVPDLDLLDSTFERRGVFQLESSRGCTFACSFCPRSHKGRWTPGEGVLFDRLMTHVSAVYARHPSVARTVFLVDEEFIGYTPDGSALSRAAAIAALLAKHDFKFENSTRVDQVYRLRQDASWHGTRIQFWRLLVSNGLKRMLFGVESGVDSILQRFNKKTTAEQNAYAIRILTACGVPIRLTYITFDPLMSLPELIASFRFLGRRDLLLKEDPALDESELFRAIHNDARVGSMAWGKPMYHEVPYMLVSMECLLGSPYLRLVEDAGLARDVSLSMGRRNVDYADRTIGLMSHASQKWIDRNFALDYALKSIGKVAEGDAARVVRETRVVLRDHAYALLANMLYVATGDETLLQDLEAPATGSTTELLATVRSAMRDGGLEEHHMEALLDAQLATLEEVLSPELDSIMGCLAPVDRAVVESVLRNWSTARSWGVINA